MRRNSLLTAVDALAFSCFALLVSTGALMKYLLPAGSGRRALIWSMNRHEWGDIHFWLAVAFFSILVLHVFLHRQFVGALILGRTPRNRPLRTASGLLLLLLLLALSVAPWLSGIQR